MPVGFSSAGRAHRATWVFIALAVVVLALAAQGRRALLLGGLGLAMLLFWRRGPGRSLLIMVLALAIAVEALHFSGFLPVESWVRGTGAGQRLLAVMRDAGIGSFPWRVGQDIKALELIGAPWVGSGQWDWWRPAGTRPWGLWQVLVGQYGLVGAGLAMTTLLGPSLWRLHRLRRVSAFSIMASVVPLAIITVLAVVDGFLNSWMCLPALFAAGAISRDAAPTSPARAN